MSTRERQSWQDDVFRVLKDHEAKHIVYVPDAGHSTAIRMAEADKTVRSSSSPPRRKESATSRGLGSAASAGRS